MLKSAVAVLPIGARGSEFSPLSGLLPGPLAFFDFKKGKKGTVGAIVLIFLIEINNWKHFHLRVS